MRTADMIKSKFWRAADLQGQPPVTLTIVDVTEELIGRGTRQETKVFLWFNEHLKGLQLNKTRVRVLEAAFGPESDLWRGKRVRLSFDPTVDFGGRAVGGVKLETPPGVVYTAPVGVPGWGAVPPGAPGLPPQPVWDAQAGQWRVPQPIAAPAAPPGAPPPPVWNPATQQWEVVQPSTGEITGQNATLGGAPTISQRIAAGPAPDEWSTHAAPAATQDFNDDIPF